jgi:hypothetical protein
MNLPVNLANTADESCASTEPHASEMAALIEAWVYRGLLHFWQSALPTDHGVYQLIQARVQAVFSGQVASGDHTVRGNQVPSDYQSSWRADWPWAVVPKATITKPLQTLVEDYQLTPASFFVVALAGQLEGEHLVNLALAELQAPDRAPRLSVHLAAAITQHLFQGEAFQGKAKGLSALELAAHPLVTGRLLDMQGDLPLPLQRLHINPWVWAILVGKLKYWPGVSLLEDGENKAKHEHVSSALPPNVKLDIAVAARLLQTSNNCAGVILRGNPQSGRGKCAQALARHLGLQAVEIPLDIWLNQPVLMQACAYGQWLPVLRLDAAPSRSLRLADSPVPVVIIVSGELTLSEGNLLDLAVDIPNVDYRYACWSAALPDAELAQQLAKCARLSAHSIQWVAQSAIQLAERSQQTLSLAHIADARARLGVDKLRLLAQPVARLVGEDALVATPLVKDSLKLLIKRAHQRESLWSGLGKTLSVTPNTGVRALFVGESGTGKTLAASYIATCLAAPLYRVDLSAVMNKYIGESEKNLAQLLDQAAACDVVLLFDEADALFGSRSNGQDNGERFANMLTNFLLTRIENHPGIVILTTNSRERIDTAFTRRLDTIIEFPMPDFEERLHLWQSHLGDRGPGDAVYRSLASYCDMAGGQVRNVVLTAVVVAGNNNIKISHLLEGLKAEYRKQGREMPRKLELLANAPVSNNQVSST